MVKEIVKDEKFLSTPLSSATKDDLFIIDDLIDTALFHKDYCIGLAANQIGYDKRIIVIRVNENTFIPLINPIITRKSKETYITEERCLSLEGARKVKRHVSIECIFKDREFKVKKVVFINRLAQVVQHEVDHCNGKII